MQSSEYECMKCVVMVIKARSASRKSRLFRNCLIHEKM